MATFTKTTHTPDQAHAEAAGLKWLAAATPEAEKSVVKVVEVSGTTLVEQRVETVRPDPESAFEFGRILRGIHRPGQRPLACRLKAVRERTTSVALSNRAPRRITGRSFTPSNVCCRSRAGHVFSRKLNSWWKRRVRASSSMRIPANLMCHLHVSMATCGQAMCFLALMAW